MNILHHKSWHVRNKNNIERVRKDEKQAADEEKERQRKIALAESEARTDQLRKKARTRDSIAGPSDESSRIGCTESSMIGCDESSRIGCDDSPCTSVAMTTKRDDDRLKTNINLFQDLENGNKQTVKNIEYEKEKKKEIEDAEKKLGILTYLGQSSIEAQTNRPWYLKVDNKDDSNKDETVDEDKRKKDSAKKSLLDPLKEISKFLAKKRKVDDDGKEIKSKKHKKKSKKHHKKSGSKTREEMREERITRERNERIRSQALMDKINGIEVKPVEAPVVDERSRAYNSAFNPELSRKRHYQH